MRLKLVYVIIFVVSIITLFSSCGKTNEDKTGYEFGYIIEEQYVGEAPAIVESTNEIKADYLFDYYLMDSDTVSVYRRVEYENGETILYRQLFSCETRAWSYTRVEIPNNAFLEDIYIHTNGAEIAIYGIDGKYYAGKIVGDAIEELLELGFDYWEYQPVWDSEDILFYSKLRNEILRCHVSGNKAKKIIPIYPICSSVRNKKATNSQFIESSDGVPVIADINGNMLQIGNASETNALSIRAYSFDDEIFFAQNGGLYFADTKAEKTEKLIDFVNKSYIFHQIWDIDKKEDSFFVLASMDDKIYRLSISEGYYSQKKEELRLATGYINVPLREAVARFNRTSDKYHITIIENDGKTAGTVYWGNLQKAILEGDVPELITDDAVEDINELINKGYIAPIELAINPNDFLDSCVDEYYSDGRWLGVPYDFSINRLVCYSQNISSGNSSVTLESFVNAVKKSDVEIVSCTYTAMDLLLTFFLSDNENDKYIDWKKGISKLNSPDFMDALLFCKAYGDNNHLNAFTGSPVDDERKYISEGKEIAVIGDIRELRDLYPYYSFFDGKPFFGGFPSKNGSGIYLRFRTVYPTKSGNKSEGARAFLEYLASDTFQKQAIDWEMPIEGVRGSTYQLPTRKDAFDYLIKKDGFNQRKSVYVNRGYKIELQNISDEQIETYRYIVNAGKAENWNINMISDIFYEELEPFFAGGKTAEEVVVSLNKRVQLYLDEKR